MSAKSTTPAQILDDPKIGCRYIIPIYGAVEIVKAYPNWLYFSDTTNGKAKGSVPRSILDACESVCEHWNLEQYCFDCDGESQ